MSNKNWENNAIQFPRLLAEIVATQGALDIPALAESMDLSVDEVNELLDRADAEWESIKAGTGPHFAVALSAFDKAGSVTDEVVVQMSSAQISDVVSHAAQLIHVRGSNSRSSGDTEKILAELEEAISASDVMEAISNSEQPQARRPRP